MTQRGRLISLEGTEGAGKSTALQFIQDYLKPLVPSIQVTREPGGTIIAETIRQVLLRTYPEEPMQAEAELLLMFAARAQHIQTTLLPALRQGHWVLSDRYIDASYAYQGGGRQMSKALIQYLDQWIVGDVYPTLTLLLDIPAALGMQRALSRGNQQDRIEQERLEFFERVRQAYLARATEAPDRIKVIDASQPLAMVQAQIRQQLDHFLANYLP